MENASCGKLSWSLLSRKTRFRPEASYRNFYIDVKILLLTTDAGKGLSPNRYSVCVCVCQCLYIDIVCIYIHILLGLQVEPQEVEQLEVRLQDEYLL